MAQATSKCTNVVSLDKYRRRRTDPPPHRPAGAARKPGGIRAGELIRDAIAELDHPRTLRPDDQLLRVAFGIRRAA
jgi:hypothetical protein